MNALTRRAAFAVPASFVAGAAAVAALAPDTSDSSLLSLHSQLRGITASMDDAARAAGLEEEAGRLEAERLLLRQMDGFAQQALACKLEIAGIPSAGMRGVLVKASILADAALMGACAATVDVAQSLIEDANRLVPGLIA